MSLIITALTSLITVAKTAFAGIAGLGWVVAIPASFFVIGLAVKFIFGLLGRGKSRKRK